MIGSKASVIVRCESVERAEELAGYIRRLNPSLVVEIIGPRTKGIRKGFIVGPVREVIDQSSIPEYLDGWQVSTLSRHSLSHRIRKDRMDSGRYSDWDAPVKTEEILRLSVAEISKSRHIGKISLRDITDYVRSFGIEW